MAVDDTTQVDETERLLMARLRQVFGGKRWIVAGEVAQGIAGGALMLESLGASDVILIASRRGVGELPEHLRFVMNDAVERNEGASMVQRMHDTNRELHDLPPRVIGEIDAWDPDHDAHVVVSFTIDAGLVANRPTFGARRRDWAELEDKILIRALWADAGIATAPDLVVELTDIEALLDAHMQLASRWGTVWAVDNDQGWHGGGKGTRWVSSAERVPQVAAELAAKHRRVRVQPFLEGIPCSMHGMVLADATLAFRPCETMVLLDEEHQTFEYSRTATFWDPDPADRQDMRATTRAIGDALRDRVDYRGVFTLDGVLTSQGFRPTEVNPRFGAALPPRLPTADGQSLPVFLMHLAAVTGNLDDMDPDALETLIVNRLDQHRAGTALVFVPDGPPQGEPIQVAMSGTWQDDQLRSITIASEDEDPFATATWGDDPAGGLIFVTFETGIPLGAPVAPVLVHIRRFLGQHLGVALANLRPPFGD